MNFVDCTLEQHGASILDIINEVIVNTTAVYDYVPRPLSSMAPWFQTKQAANYPVIGAEDAQGRLLGFATYGAFRAWPAYKYAVELSLYLAVDARGRGLGPLLLARLIEEARARGVHCMVAGIDSANQRSVALHERQGFVLAGSVRQCGFKFGRWLDLLLYQLLLPTPDHPVDG